MLCAKVGVLHPFVAMLRPLLAMRSPFVAMLRPLLAMLRRFLAVLRVFAATRSEGEDASHEESRGHRTLHGVPDPSRGRGKECVASSERPGSLRTLSYKLFQVTRSHPSDPQTPLSAHSTGTLRCANRERDRRRNTRRPRRVAELLAERLKERRHVRAGVPTLPSRRLSST